MAKVVMNLASEWMRYCIPGGLAIAFAAAVGMDLAAAPPLEEWRNLKEARPDSYVCYRAEKPPKIDGRLDDACWRAAEWTRPFADIEGAKRPAPMWRTRAKMLWDDEHLYISAELDEPNVWATLEKHDSVIFRDNDFEVFIDPNGDNHEYYELELNALNTTWDLFLPKPYKDGGKADDGFELSGLKTAVHVDGTLNDPRDTDRGWSVEIAIPWKGMAKYAHGAAPPAEGDQWRINFSRVEWQVEVKDGKTVKKPNTPENNWIWSPQGIIDMHRPERWPYVQFTSGKPGAVTFKPDGLARARDVLMEIYYRQRAVRERDQKWSDRDETLGLSSELWKGFPGRPTIRLTEAGFEALLPVAVGGKSAGVMHVDQDSRLWRTEK